VIPLNQLIPECLLALGGAYLLGNLAAYIRLRPAWRDAKEGHGGQAAAKRNAKQPQRAQAVERGAVKGGGGQAVNATTGTRGKAGRTGPGTGRGTRPAGTAPGQTGSGEGRRGRVRPESANAAAGQGPRGAKAAGSAGASAAGSESAGAKAAAGPRTGSSGRVNARVREPARSGSKLPSRTRVLTNVLIGLLISAAALATLIRG
jgi:hypothetical protein